MCVCALDQCWLVCGRPGRRDNLHTMGQPKLQALVYDILPLEEGAEKRCSECEQVEDPPPSSLVHSHTHSGIRVLRRPSRQTKRSDRQITMQAHSIRQTLRHRHSAVFFPTRLLTATCPCFSKLSAVASRDANLLWASIIA